MSKQRTLLEIKCTEIGMTCSCFSLRKASRAVTQIFDEAFKPTGLRGTQVSVLVAIHLGGTVTISRLARWLVMDRTTLTRNLKPLEKMGLVETVEGKDRRTRAVTLTPQGREALERVLPLWEQAQTRIIEGLGHARWQGLMKDLAATSALAG